MFLNQIQLRFLCFRIAHDLCEASRLLLRCSVVNSEKLGEDPSSILQLFSISPNGNFLFNKGVSYRRTKRYKRHLRTRSVSFFGAVINVLDRLEISSKKAASPCKFDGISFELSLILSFCEYPRHFNR